MKKIALGLIVTALSVVNTNNAMFHVGFAFPTSNLDQWYEKYFENLKVPFTSSRFSKEPSENHSKLALLTVLVCYQDQIKCVADAIKEKTVPKVLESLIEQSQQVYNAYLSSSTDGGLNFAVDTFLGLAENKGKWRERWGRFFCVLAKEKLLQKTNDEFEDEVERRDYQQYYSRHKKDKQTIRKEVQQQLDEFKSLLEEIVKKFTPLAVLKNMSVQEYIYQELHADINQANQVIQHCFALIKKNHPQIFKKVENECLKEQLAQKMRELRKVMDKEMKKQQLKEKKERLEKQLEQIKTKLENAESIY